MENLLSEENYQKTNKKVKLCGIIIMSLGLCLVIGGIIALISASRMDIPSMSDPNWYDASSMKMHRQSTGAFMIIPGIFLSIVGASVRFIIANRRELMAYRMQQMMPIATEGMEKMVPVGTKLGKDVAKEMAPVYGDVAKEITKGIKEGLKEEK